MTFADWWDSDQSRSKFHPMQLAREAYEAGVAAERERCAALVESSAGPLRTGAYDALIAAAEAIRGA